MSFNQREEEYFSNKVSIDEFSKSMIKELSIIKNIIILLKENRLESKNIEALEYEAFNLLISRIEFEKGNSRVEVGVIGSFTSGKSTFINSLFGKSICPMAVKPTTSSITKFYYGEREKITIDGKEISYGEYKKLSQHLKNSSKDTKTYYIEYAYPFDRLNSIVLYDTPGFNNNLNKNDEIVTMRALDSVDVIFFLIDISKGSVDDSSLERLKKLKDKRIYCILNKSDLKSSDAITKIRKEIESKKIFLEVIEYSAIKVLQEGKKDYFSEYISNIENIISKREPFNSTIKGYRKEIKSRLSNSFEYYMEIDDRIFTIDSFYTKAKVQKSRVEKLLNNLSISKQFTLKQKIRTEEYKYNKKSYIFIENLLNKVDRELSKHKLFKRFNEDIKKFKDELIEFEQKYIDNFYKEWNYTFINSCNIIEDDKKNYFTKKNIYKILFDNKKFNKYIKRIDFIKYLEKFLNRWIILLNLEYKLKIKYLDIRDSIEDEASKWYAKLYDRDGYLLKDGKSYFKDKRDAKEFLNSLYSFKSKSTIHIIHNILDYNKEAIEDKRRELRPKKSIDIDDMEKLKGLLENFLREKRVDVKRV